MPGTIVQQVTGCSTVGFATVTLPNPVTAGNVLLVGIARRGPFSGIENEPTAGGQVRLFTEYLPNVSPAATDSDGYFMWRVATGDEQTLIYGQSNLNIMTYELSGVTAVDMATATVLRVDAAGGPPYTIGTLGANGWLCFQLVMYDRDFEDTDYYTMGVGWTTDFSDSSTCDGAGRPYVEVGHATPSGPIVATSTATISPGWGGMAIAIFGVPALAGATGGPGLLIEYFDNDPNTFGPAALAGVIHDAIKTGWSWYSRYPANAFFTLRQDSVHNSRLSPNKTHIKITYFNPRTGHSAVVFTGRIGEPDSSGEDVVWTSWNYQAELSLSRTGYRIMYPTKLIGTEIAAIEWGLAKNATFSLLEHVATGTIEDPLGTDELTPIKTDARFGVIDVPRLLLLFDLTEIGRANTVHNVTMGITRTAPFTFFFLKNAGTLRSGKALVFPTPVRDYRHVPGFASLRNDLATIGTSAAGSAVEIVKTDEANAQEFGRRQDVFQIKTLSGVVGAATEEDAQNAITARAVKEATTLSKNVVVELVAGEWEPFDGWDIEDTIPVEIRRGKDVITGNYRIVGVRGLLDERGYHPQLFIQQPTAA